MPRAADNEDWSGIIFANNWQIVKKLSSAEYRKIYVELTGDTDKIIKNTHYFIRNLDCGVETYMERTVIQRALRNKTPRMSKCRNCANCYYKEQARIKNLTKVPDREQKVFENKIYGNFLVKKIYPSSDYSDHQQRADVECCYCGATKLARLNSILEGSLACDCFRSHSSGEMAIKNYLTTHQIPYRAEYVFDDLIGIGGGKLRYDFAVLNPDNTVKLLIEFDGQQHFQEAGTYYNPTGKVQVHDKIKDDYANLIHIPLIRIPYTDFLNINSILDKALVEEQLL